MESHTFSFPKELSLAVLWLDLATIVIVCIIDYLQCTTLTALSFPASANGNIDKVSIFEKEADLADDTEL